MSLFNVGNFTLHSGARSDFIIDCDALSDDDLEALARMAVNALPSFGSVVGVPRGGLRFAKILSQRATQGPTLIVDDVLTTGASMQQMRSTLHSPTMGLVIFARCAVPTWITALWSASVLRSDVLELSYSDIDVDLVSNTGHDVTFDEDDARMWFGDLSN